MTDKKNFYGFAQDGFSSKELQKGLNSNLIKKSLTSANLQSALAQSQPATSTITGLSSEGSGQPVSTEASKKTE